MKRSYFAMVLVTTILALSGCDELDDVQQLRQQVAQLREFNQKLEREILDLNEKLSMANAEIEKFREENSRNLNQLFR